MTVKPIPEDIGEYLKYDPDTGDVVWIKKPSLRANIRIGDKATNMDAKSYYVVGFKNSVYKLHRVIWFLQTGKQPIETIDHKDGNHTNNKWSNLREATKQENNRNRNKQRNNTSGFKGVSWLKSNNSWVAQATLDTNRVYLGCFATPELAHAAYCNFIEEYHKEFANSG